MCVCEYVNGRKRAWSTRGRCTYETRDIFVSACVCVCDKHKRVVFIEIIEFQYLCKYALYIPTYTSIKARTKTPYTWWCVVTAGRCNIESTLKKHQTVCFLYVRVFSLHPVLCITTMLYACIYIHVRITFTSNKCFLCVLLLYIEDIFNIVPCVLYVFCIRLALRTQEPTFMRVCQCESGMNIEYMDGSSNYAYLRTHLHGLPSFGHAFRLPEEVSEAPFDVLFRWYCTNKSSRQRKGKQCLEESPCFPQNISSYQKLQLFCKRVVNGEMHTIDKFCDKSRINPTEVQRYVWCLRSKGNCPIENQSPMTISHNHS